MSEFRKDLIEIEDFLSSVSDYGKFERRKDPEFLTLKCMWERAQRDLARQQFVCMQFERMCQFYFSRMIAMVEDKPLDTAALEKVEEQIAVFLTKLKNGDYSNVNS